MPTYTFRDDCRFTCEHCRAECRASQESLDAQRATDPDGYADVDDVALARDFVGCLLCAEVELVNPLGEIVASVVTGGSTVSAGIAPQVFYNHVRYGCDGCGRVCRATSDDVPTDLPTLCLGCRTGEYFPAEYVR